MSAFVPKESRIGSNLNYVSHNQTPLLDVWKCSINIANWGYSEFIIKGKFLMRIIK